MKKFGLIAGIVILVIAAGAGGTFAFLKLYSPGAKAASLTKKLQQPSPIYFAKLDNVVVSIPATASNPADAGDPPSSVFLQFSIEFETGDENQVNNFNIVEPIIEARILRLLMQENAQSLQNTNEQSKIEQASLNLANTTLETGHYAQTAPFSAALITNLVVQD
jgi:flagellar basal body-associated protein FliL